MMVKVEVKMVPSAMAEDFTFEYTDDIDTPAKVIRLMRMQLDSDPLALIDEIKMTFANGSTVINSGPLHWNNKPMDDMEKLVSTLAELGIPYEAYYDANTVIIKADASDKYVGVAFDDSGKYSFSN